MPALATRVSSIHAQIGGSAYVSPATPLLAHMKSALIAAGILGTNGAYLPGRSQSDLTRELAVPSIHSELLHRLADSQGL